MKKTGKEKKRSKKQKVAARMEETTFESASDGTEIQLSKRKRQRSPEIDEEQGKAPWLIK
jgi:hypothetical protein